MGVKGFFSFLRDLKAFVPINLLSEAEKFLNDTGKQKKKLTIVVDGGSFVHFLIDKYQVSKMIKKFYLLLFVH
jgi:isopentenyl phosphate kinase